MKMVTRGHTEIDPTLYPVMAKATTVISFHYGAHVPGTDSYACHGTWEQPHHAPLPVAVTPESYDSPVAAMRAAAKLFLEATEG